MTPGVFPRLVLGAASSGAGKTTVACGLMAAFRRRGLRVQPFKTGPDYIDPGFHTLAAGRESRNLDSRLMPRGAVVELFRRAAGDADLSVVEGVMGLYDGAGALDERGSTAHLAKILSAPVIILLDVKSAARSAAAAAWGFSRFDRKIRAAGFILNRVGSPSHFSTVKTAVEAATGLPVFGGLYPDEGLRMPERHLGLVPAWEAGTSPDAAARWNGYFAALADKIESTVDLDAVLAAARAAPEPPRGTTRVFGGFPPPREKTTTIACARDDAFHFYYRDNLDILRRYGARIVFFSPLEDGELPPETSGLYFGGGYPELHAEKLAANAAMLEAVRSAAGSGMPVLAECGGYMYLAESLRTFEGREYPMAGVLPVRVTMEKKLRALGYHDGTLLADCLLGRKGEVCPGHVFHWSRAEKSCGGNPAAGNGKAAVPLFSLTKPGREPFEDGFSLRNVAAGYLHMHFASRPGWAGNFVRTCRRYGRLAGGKTRGLPAITGDKA